MTALGSCSEPSSSTVVLNEITTSVSASALAPFAPDPLTGNKAYEYIGTSSGNLTGLANAFATVNNLVDISTGKVRFTVPAGNASVPYVEINTLADGLDACAVTSGGVRGDGSACSHLFTATDVVNLGNAIVPTDTLQAAFNIAQHPVNNYGYVLDTTALYGLATPGSTFQPILAAQPSDWSISLNYISGGGLSKDSTIGDLALDAEGNLWITDINAGSIIEWNTVGAALSPANGFPAGGGPIAIDAAGNVWVSGNGSLNELTNLGSPLPWSPFGGVTGGGGEIAIDGQGNVWITNSGGVNEFDSLGEQLSPISGYTNDGVTNISALGIDSSNDVWLGTSVGAGIAELTNPAGRLIANSTGVGGAIAPEIASDGAGDVWLTVAGYGVCEALPFGGKGSIQTRKCYPENLNPPNGVLTTDPSGLAVDGAGTIWVAGRGGGNTGNADIPPGVLPLKPSLPNSFQSAVQLASSSLAAGPLRVAVDGAGNIWVLLADNTITEYIGAAAPTVTPLALALKDKKIGTKP